MKALVIAEHDHKTLKATTLACVGAAQQITEDVTVWVLGHGVDSVAQNAASLKGVRTVFQTEAETLKDFLAENMAATILQKARDFTHILAPASTFGKNLLPRIAALLDCEMVSDILKIIGPNQFVRPIYAGNALETIESKATIHLLTVRGNHFQPVALGGQAVIEAVAASHSKASVRFIDLQASGGERPELTSARIVVSGGRGVQTAEHFKLVEQLAEKLNAAVGASRAAVDAGFAPNDWQVGQTGKIVAPDLYIAVGISGAIQHIAGMKDSKCIVAINKDPDAPIFQVADYGLVADLFEVVPQLMQLL